jgi:hypothetical protein
MSVLTTTTQHNIPEDGILYSHCHENPKSHTIFYFFSLPCSGIEGEHFSFTPKSSVYFTGIFHLFNEREGNKADTSWQTKSRVTV